MFRIPSVQTLRVLEACYRLNSFTRAGDELGISQGAVSQQIKSLEQRLGFAVFVREGRSIRPTHSGEQLVHAVRQGFGHIADVIAQEKRKQQHNELLISVLPGFAIRWLFPRLMSFEQENPAYRLTVNAISHPDHFSLHHGHAAVVYREVADTDTGVFFSEHMYPVCSPEYAHQHQLKNGESVLKHWQLLNLLRDTSPTAARYSDGWSYWQESVALQQDSMSDDEDSQTIRQRYSQANITLQLAELGHGLALGRTSLVMDAIKERKLVAFGELAVKNPCRYQLVLNPEIPESEAILAFRQWLTRQTQVIREFEHRTNILKF